ncbi:MAG: DUF1360 domain-containing protein [Aquihabitans sp.]
MSRAPSRPAPGSVVAIELVVDALATYRLTRLATADVISEPLRRSVVGRSLRRTQPDAEIDMAPSAPTAQELVDDLADPPKAARLVTCRWCAGMWIAGGVVAARTIAPRWWDPAARALALSAAAVLVARAEDG